MELPIRIIIILFVAIVVGGMMIVFSQQVLMKAQVNLNDQQDKKLGGDKIIETDTLSAEALTGLARQCRDENLGVSFTERDCFAVFGSNLDATAALDGHDLGKNYTIDASAYSTGQSAIRITFDPFGTIIIS